MKRRTAKKQSTRRFARMRRFENRRWNRHDRRSDQAAFALMLDELHPGSPT